MEEERSKGGRTLTFRDVGGRIDGVTKFLVEFGIPLERVQIVPLSSTGSERKFLGSVQISMSTWAHRVFFYEEDIVPETMERMPEFLRNFSL